LISKVGWGEAMERTFRTKREKVYFHLQDEIIKGVIRPGSKLVISKLAKRFNMSEIPVREALQTLAQEGYVVLNPHSGVTVNSLSEDDIRQLFEIRINLESLAARLAVDHLSNSHIRTLEQMIEKSKEFLDNQDLQGYGHFNRSFHEYIYQHSNNQRLYMMVVDLWDFSTWHSTYFSSLQDIEISIAEHKEIVDALSDKNADLIEKLIKDHTTNVYHQVIRRFVQQENKE
jgi:DNA-binding GntR family transcriptional regulator